MRFYDIIGSLGVFFIVLAYFLLQIEKLSSRDLTYSILNLSGASLIIFSLVFEFNFSAFMIEFFWVIISLIGIYKGIRK
ncbi:MAG: hypothetical protein SCALA702_03600 [Melioribacteraceae bacterium]|nr:MAG: hypothetical protein SCALA702_03600 [Melioribacteraceae bacterium]